MRDIFRTLHVYVIRVRDVLGFTDEEILVYDSSLSPFHFLSTQQLFVSHISKAAEKSLYETTFSRKVRCLSQTP